MTTEEARATGLSDARDTADAQQPTEEPAEPREHAARNTPGAPEASEAAAAADASFSPAYYNAVDQMYHAEWVAAKLARFEVLRRSLAALWPEGHPSRIVHVAGTSGKGSVCRYLEAGLALDGPSGALTSPHLFDFRERITLSGVPASQDEIIAAWEEVVRPRCVALELEHPGRAHTVSEVCLLVALVIFARRGVRWAVIETGVGGRYDTTTVPPAEVAVLTTIGSDHQHVLGSEVWQRALDKAGIIRPERPCFSSVVVPEAARVIAAICARLRAPLRVVGADEAAEVSARLQALYPEGLPAETLLRSGYQRRNAALALAVIHALAPTLDENTILRQFAGVRFAGRFQRVGGPSDVETYADIAHNAEKLTALVEEAHARFPDRPLTFVVGLSGDRTPAEVFAPVLARAARLIVTSAGYKGQNPEAIAAALRDANPCDVPISVVADPQEALAEAQARAASEEGVVLLTGSTYTIDSALNPDPYLRHLNATWGWRNASRLSGPIR